VLPAGDRYLLGIDTNIGYVAICEDSGMLQEYEYLSTCSGQ
jgi:hypothetical protein